MDIFCPNKPTCKLIQDDCTFSTSAQRNFFMEQFCISQDHKWETCKRFQTKSILGFCPDFVLPNACHTVDEIIDEFDSN
jgi:hypothetical protein